MRSVFIRVICFFAFFTYLTASVEAKEDLSVGSQGESKMLGLSGLSGGATSELFRILEKASTQMKLSIQDHVDDPEGKDIWGNNIIVHYMGKHVEIPFVSALFIDYRKSTYEAQPETTPKNLILKGEIAKNLFSYCENAAYAKTSPKTGSFILRGDKVVCSNESLVQADQGEPKEEYRCDISLE